MKIDISTLGRSLVSRPLGREAALALMANTLKALPAAEPIELDFSNVLVLTPSWADEFIAALRTQFSARLKIILGANASVRLALETIGEKVL